VFRRFLAKFHVVFVLPNRCCGWCLCDCVCPAPATPSIAACLYVNVGYGGVTPRTAPLTHAFIIIIVIVSCFVKRRNVLLSLLFYYFSLSAHIFYEFFSCSYGCVNICMFSPLAFLCRLIFVLIIFIPLLWQTNKYLIK